MPNFFKKLSSGTNNMFKKLDSGASNFFKKLPNETDKISGQIGNGLNMVGGKIAGVATKAGNFLEKNSAILADAGAGVAMALGQPELAPIIMGAGASGQALGQRLKQGGSQAQSGLNNLAAMQQRQLNNTAAQVSGAGMRNLGQVRVGVSNATNALDNMASSTNGLNNLTIH